MSLHFSKSRYNRKRITAAERISAMIRRFLPLLLPLAALCVLLFACAPPRAQEPARTDRPPTLSMPSARQTASRELPPERDTRVKIVLAGDVTLSGAFSDMLQSRSMDYCFGETAALFREADFAAVNLECAVSLRGESVKPEGYGFRSPPGNLESLLRAGIDAVSLANNHVLDFGYDAFSDTLRSLDDAGILYAGAGETLTAAAAPALFYTENGTVVGFLAMTERLPFRSWRADADRGGLYVLDYDAIDAVCETVSAAKARCDILVVSVHWGTEYSGRVLQKQEEAARKMVDAGADLIFGHHPHLLQKIERYNNRLILYSTGNFLFFKRDDFAGESAVFEIDMDQNGLIGLTLHPTFTVNCRAGLLEEESERYRRILELLSGNSRNP